MPNDEAVKLGKENYMSNYSQFPISIRSGKGIVLTDEDEKKALLSVIESGVLHTSNLYYNSHAVHAAAALNKLAGSKEVFFCNSGAEANEAALKMARKSGSESGKSTIISFAHSFHGRTYGAITVTGQEKYHKGFAPMLPGVVYAEYNNLDSVKALMDERTAAIIVEPLQGEGGIIPATHEFLSGLRSLCDSYGALLIFDEVQCGMGRTGSFFAWQSFGIEPDALSMAKALGNGYPIGAMVAKRKYSHVLTPGTHARTFGGTALASAAACAVIDAIDNEKILDNVARQSGTLMDGLSALSKKYPCIRGVRGRGLMVGAVLDRPAGAVLGILRSKGMIALSAGENVLRLVPPLNVSDADCALALELIDGAFAELCAK